MSAGPQAEQRFEQILRDTHLQVRAYISGLGVSLHDVDDVAQEVYLELYADIKRMPAGIKPIRWLKGIARNLCLNHFRKEKRAANQQLEALAELLHRTTASLDAFQSGDGILDVLNACIGKLSAKNRKLIALFYEKGNNSRTIGQMWDVRSDAIRATLVRIRSVLKDCITATLKLEA